MVSKLRSFRWRAAGIALAALLFAFTAGHAQPPGALPRPPAMPRMPGNPGGGMPGGLGGGFEYVYKCQNCKGELSRSSSPFPPNIEKCPHCGVRLNTMAGNQAEMHDRMREQMGRGGWNDPPGATPNGPNGPQQFAPNTPVNPPPPEPPPPAPEPTPPPAATPAPTFPSNTPSTPPAAARAGVGVAIVLVWVFVGIVGLLMFVALIGGVIWLVSSAPSMSGPAPRRRPRRPRHSNYTHP